MDLYFIIIVVAFLSPVMFRVLQEYCPNPRQQLEMAKKTQLTRISKATKALEDDNRAKEKAIREKRSRHRGELSDFDTQLLEIERPIILKALEQRATSVDVPVTPENKGYWTNQHLLARNDYHAIREITPHPRSSSDEQIYQAAWAHLSKITGYIRRIEKMEQDATKHQFEIPDRVFDFIEAVNDPDQHGFKLVKAMKDFLGDDLPEEDIYYGRLTISQVSDMVTAKMDMYTSRQDFGDLMAKAALRRVSTSNNPEKLMKLWGVTSES
jgi:hypothetical protein